MVSFPSVTYVVNMDAATERMAFMKTQLDAQGVPYTRVAAVHGAKLTGAEVKAQTTTACRMACTRSMVGCAMSHRSIWWEVLRSQRTALVLEDDAVLCANFRARVEEALTACPSDVDVLLLGSFFLSDVRREYPLGLKLLRLLAPNLRDDTRTWTSGGTTVYVPEMSAGTHAYVVTPKGAAALFKAIPRIGYHVDIQMNHPSVRLYAASPDLAFQRDMMMSSITSNAFPTIAAPLLRGTDPKGISVAYYLSSEAGRVGGICINVWFFIFLTAGLVAPARWWPYVAGYLALETAAGAGAKGVAVGVDGTLGPAVAYVVGSAVRRCLFMSW